jgi:Rps23 Pro-64 3,4-dihydroxylase Tpa1-like proline 4-hydroxylase
MFPRMLNPHLDLPDWAGKLRSRGRIQIPEFLQPEAADRVASMLEREVPWTLAVRTDADSHTVPADDYRAMADHERRRIVDAAGREAGEGFSFAYESYQMITNYLAQRDPDLMLHRVTEFLNSQAFLAFCRQLTGDTAIVKLDCQATCYRGGHFLTRHDDRLEDEGRRFAYVLGLTRRWRADWGGLLQFLDADGAVVETLMPRFNALSVFRVPADHYVSIVAPFAVGGRYSITGWMRSR